MTRKCRWGRKEVEERAKGKRQKGKGKREKGKGKETLRGTQQAAPLFVLAALVLMRAALRYNAPKMEIDKEHLRILRAMTPEQKLRTAEGLYDSARELKAAVLRADHPEWTEEQVQRAVREWLLYARS